MAKKESQIGPLDALPRVPAHLSPGARVVWKDVGAYLLDRGLLHSGDLLTLEVYAMGVAKLRQLEREMLDQPIITEDGKIHASLHALNTLSGVVQKGAAQLGLAPVSRARLSVKEQREKKKTPDDEQWLHALEGGRS